MKTRLELNRRTTLALGAFTAASTLWNARAQAAAIAIDSATIDAVVARFRQEFEIPGVGIAIIAPGQAPFLKGYGVRALGQSAQVDLHTQFAIASNSKAFTSAALAILVDAGKLAWEDPVIKHLPEFRMYDPAVTQMMTVRDLLLHRSGLPLGAGDLLQFPVGDHTREDLLRALPHFKPATGFRDGYAYDNILYIIAGLVLERISGQSWDDFVASKLFAPLGMRDAVTNPTLVRGLNHTARHARLGPPVIGMGKLETVPPAETAIIAPAGGINASISDAALWLKVQLAQGVLPDGHRLWSKAQSDEMWKPQTITASGPGPTPEAPQRSVISAYALGWGVSEYRGRRMLAHSGGLVGQITRTTLLPDHGIGFVVYSNTGDEEPISGLRYAILDRLIDSPPFDWLAYTRARIQKTQTEVMAVMGTSGFTSPAGGPSLIVERYVGRYRDPWYGDIVVGQTNGVLSIDFTHTSIFKSRLEPFGPDSFRTRFPRGAGEDAVIHFAVKDGRIVEVTMNALSPLADFSFDFKDLHFVPVGP